jgi:hypothetical protein
VVVTAHRIETGNSLAAPALSAAADARRRMPGGSTSRCDWEACHSACG